MKELPTKVAARVDCGAAPVVKCDYEVYDGGGLWSCANGRIGAALAKGNNARGGGSLSNGKRGEEASSMVEAVRSIARSATKSMESSKAFFRRPLWCLEKVTCRLARFSIILICIFPLHHVDRLVDNTPGGSAEFYREQQNQRARSSDQSWPREDRQGGIKSEEGDEESRLPDIGSRKSGGG
ncbi:hypothetical protein ZIOFF_009974 [Zingiber officinale]|uniref:Uncharacterized protein n=1 Tax=Zingiber officinale TaxID=94328 RepID=A0A8J5LP31_ZINOF|nr:hypothetical protein ZIOFF_009974 [Zingiber officinale]